MGGVGGEKPLSKSSAFDQFLGTWCTGVRRLELGCPWSSLVAAGSLDSGNKREAKHCDFS